MTQTVSERTLDLDGATLRYMVDGGGGKFTVQPGRREEFASLFESLVSLHMSSMRAAGCSDSTLYTVIDEPDMAVEIADWESANARNAMMQSDAMAAFAPLFELRAAPPNATVVNAMH